MQQFIPRLDDDDVMVSDILRKVSASEDINNVKSERVLLWPQREEAQKVQKVTLNIIMEAKDSLKCITQEQDNEIHKQRWLKNFKYCGRWHAQRQCPVYSKSCRGYGKTNHFKTLCRSVQR